MLIEALTAIIIIFVSTFVIYALGKRSAPKTGTSGNQHTSYACGEKVSFQGLTVNVSLYKYLIYFVVADSAVLLLAFASVSIVEANPILLILYLGLLLVAALNLLSGGND